MKGLPWFRMYTDFLKDPKIVSLAFEDQRHFVGVLALKASGFLDQKCDAKLMDRMVAQELWLDPLAVLEVRRRLVDAGLIHKNWQPVAWEKRQYVSDKSTDRVRKYRENKKKNTGNGDETLQKRSSNADVTPPDTDTDTEKMSTANAVDVPALAGTPPQVAPQADDSAPAETVITPDDPPAEKPEGSNVHRMDPTPYAAILALYHENLPQLRAVEVLNDLRRRLVRARWRENPDLAHWRKYFRYVSTSGFLTGKVQLRKDEPPFEADFEWLMRPTNYAKVIEGKYHRNNNGRNQQGSR